MLLLVGMMVPSMVPSGRVVVAGGAVGVVACSCVCWHFVGWVAGTRRLRNRRPKSDEARIRALTDTELEAAIIRCRESCRASRSNGKEAKAAIDEFQRSQAQAAREAGKDLNSIVATPYILECREVVTRAKSDERQFRDLRDEVRRRYVQAEAIAVLGAVAGAGARESAEGVLRAASGEQSAGDGSGGRVARAIVERLQKEAGPRLQEAGIAWSDVCVVASSLHKLSFEALGHGDVVALEQAGREALDRIVHNVAVCAVARYIQNKLENAGIQWAEAHRWLSACLARASLPALADGLRDLTGHLRELCKSTWRGLQKLGHVWELFDQLINVAFAEAPIMAASNLLRFCAGADSPLSEIVGMYNNVQQWAAVMQERTVAHQVIHDLLAWVKSDRMWHGKLLQGFLVHKVQKKLDKCALPEVEYG